MDAMALEAECPQRQGQVHPLSQLQPVSPGGEGAGGGIKELSEGKEMLGVNVMLRCGKPEQNSDQHPQENGTTKQELAPQCSQLPPGFRQSPWAGKVRDFLVVVPPEGQSVQGVLLSSVHPGGQEVLQQQPGLHDIQDVCSLKLRHEVPQGGVLDCKHPEGQTICPLTDIGPAVALTTQDSGRRRARRSLPDNSMVEASKDTVMLCGCKLKKRVQFADSFGLTLASVKHFLSSEEPTVPPAVLARLQSYPPHTGEQRAELHPEESHFNGPASAELLIKLETQRLCLEHVSASSWGVKGTVLLQDPPDEVQVKIRYTFNDWLSYLDCPASVLGLNASVCSSPAPGVQRFLFNLCYPPTTLRIQFAICCNLGYGQEMWDNNQGSNYSVDCQQEIPLDFHASDPENDPWGGPQHW